MPWQVSQGYDSVKNPNKQLQKLLASFLTKMRTKYDLFLLQQSF